MPEELKDIPFPIPLQEGAVYGPLHSKRLGLSLGINLLPRERKVCNLDCLYCFYGRTNFRYGGEYCPPAEDILAEVETEFKKRQIINYITFSGNGAATMHPEFPALVKAIKFLRDEYYPGIPLAILSNSAGLDSERILEAFTLFDHPIMKLDAGDDATFRKLNRPRKGIKFRNIVEILHSLRGITLQTLFVDGFCNCRGKKLDNWLETVNYIDPAAVQIYTLDRSLPDSELLKLEDAELLRLEEHIRERTSIPVKAFPAKY